MKIDYYPDSMSMWTPGLTHDGSMFYLQFYGQDSTRDPADTDWLGHATSPDLLHWTERSLAIGPGPARFGGLWPWTALVEHAGTFSSTTRCGPAWTRAMDRGSAWRPARPGALGALSGQPCARAGRSLVRRYERPLAEHTVDCRDMVVTPDPDGNGWLGYFAARVHPGPPRDCSDRPGPFHRPHPLGAVSPPSSQETSQRSKCPTSTRSMAHGISPV